MGETKWKPMGGNGQKQPGQTEQGEILDQMGQLQGIPPMSYTPVGGQERNIKCVSPPEIILGSQQ